MALTIRENCSRHQLWAHGILDDVRAGVPVSARDIRRALRVLGDMA